MNEELRVKGELAREAAYKLANTSTEAKNKMLLAMAEALVKEEENILQANAQDMETARQKGTGKAMLDRLLLTSSRIKDMAEGLKAVAALPDPVGEVEAMWKGAQDIEI